MSTTLLRMDFPMPYHLHLYLAESEKRQTKLGLFSLANQVWQHITEQFKYS